MVKSGTSWRLSGGSWWIEALHHPEWYQTLSPQIVVHISRYIHHPNPHGEIPKGYRYHPIYSMIILCWKISQSIQKKENEKLLHQSGFAIPLPTCLKDHLPSQIASWHVFRMPFSLGNRTYCWWKKSQTTTWDGAKTCKQWGYLPYQLVFPNFSHQQYTKQKYHPQVSTETQNPSIKCKQANAKAPEIMSTVRSGFDLLLQREFYPTPVVALSFDEAFHLYGELKKCLKTPSSWWHTSF